PYAGENVFRRESTMVSTLLQERFDAKGRVLHLLNHPETATSPRPQWLPAPRRRLRCAGATE
ncbi:MAG: hypothetical protein EOO29_21350, partial [Comamonadaceae bacterium]